MLLEIQHLHKEGLGAGSLAAAVKLHLLLALLDKLELYIFLHVLLACKPNIVFNAVFLGGPGGGGCVKNTLT